MQYLSDEFLLNYPDFTPHQSEISKFTFLRTYSRYMENKKRREVWRETPARAVDFSLDLERQHREKLGLPIDYKRMQTEAEELYDNIYNLRQFPSGRTMWVGGADNNLGLKFALANFNCSFTNIAKWQDMVELFYLLLVGVGVGLKSVFELIAQLAPIRTDIETIHEEYTTVYPTIKVDDTARFVNFDEGTALIQIGDSKEGWCQAMQYWFDLHTDELYDSIHTITMNYDLVRPQGSRLHTFGGTASGPEPLMEMFQLFDKVLHNQVDPDLDPLEVVGLTGTGVQWVKVRPIHILDMANAVGHNVVVGGVRRTSEIDLMSANDWESIFAKYGINGFWDEATFERHDLIGKLLREQGIPVPKFWPRLAVKEWVVFYGDKQKKWFGSDENGAKAFAGEFGGYAHYPANQGRPMPHRKMSNNSIAFTEKPSREFLHLIFTIMRGEGEPGFVNLRELAKRRFRALGVKNPTEEQYQQMMLEIGMNPCAEIDLRSKGVCNLTTVNVCAFVKDGHLQKKKLLRAQRLSARIGLRMTLIQLELPEWDKVQQEDRLLGCSLTGWKDAMEQLGYDRQQEKRLRRELHDAAVDEANAYAKELRINPPLLVTALKPEGTLSNVAVNSFGSPVSSGAHWGHAPYYIRRIRANAHDPVAKVARELGWVVNPEFDTPGSSLTEKWQNARTVVVDFPVESGAVKTKNEITVEEQFESYFDFQEDYVDHNTSNTITLNAEKGEWEKAEEIVFNNWDRFAAVSFLALDGGTYQLMPFETVTKAQYQELKNSMAEFNFDLLAKYENPDEEIELVADGCDTGVCPIR